MAELVNENKYDEADGERKWGHERISADGEYHGEQGTADFAEFKQRQQAFELG
jgi:hypothetical protein